MKWMSPLIGQVPVNNAVEMPGVGVGRQKRERANEEKRERILECSVYTEGNREKSSHYTKFHPNESGRFGFRSTLPTWSSK